MHHILIRRFAIASVAVAWAVPFASNAGAAVVADWQFEPGALLVDSSGNGHTLQTNVGAPVGSSDVSATGGSGSAYFDGSSVLQTVSSLDLSPYRQLRFSWNQKVVGATIGIAFEHTPNWNSNVGGILAVDNGDQRNRSDYGYVGISNYNIDEFVHDDTAVGTPVWESFSAIIDLDAANAGDVVKIFDGSGTLIGTNNGAYQKYPVSNFLNSQFFIGGRSGGVVPLNGYIDNLRIESVPEPTALVLLGVAGVGLLAGRRRVG